MSTESNPETGRRKAVLLVGAIAASVALALIVDGTQSAPADASTAETASTSITRDPAAATQALPAGHPPLDGAQPLAAADQQLPVGHPPIDGDRGSATRDSTSGIPAGHPPMQDGKRQDAIEPGSIAAAQGDGAVTVSTLIRDAEAHEGKKVRLAAKVMRMTPNVLGKTWLHVGDGTGSADKGDHDLVVTTLAQPQVGDVVILEGVVSRNKDLGSGYRYDVLLEDAKITPAPGR
jgi:hypothetical protein